MKNHKWASLLAALLCVAQLLVPMSAMASTAQTPTRVPEVGEAVTVYTKADMVLDFSAYVFSTMDSAGVEQPGGIHGLSNIMKIWVATTDQQQFTAYCLDMNRHYPAAISDTGEQALYVRDTDSLLALFVQTLKNDTAANGSDPASSALFGDLMAAHGDITAFSFLPATVVDQAMLDAFNNNERIEFLIHGARFADGYELTRDDGHWVYGFWRKTMTQTDNFITTAWPSGAQYDKMLWVIEHSYPAISMDAMMHDAGADYDRLYQEVAASQSGLSSTELDELVETIVYATIQEAVWHHQPAIINDDPERYIGAQLIQGHQDAKLLYGYLTQEREKYDGYRNKIFGTNIAIEHPADLTPVQNGASYTYGPFSISSDMLSAGTISVSVDAEGVTASVTDSDGTALAAVRAGQAFFVRTDARPDDPLTLKAKTANALTLTHADRGRMYVHADAQQAAELQPVGTGGTPDTVSADDALVLPAVAPPVILDPTGERISFKKIDADTHAPLDGAVIRVVDGNGATVFQGTTDNGIVVTDVELAYDTDYFYFEVTPPDGYALDETRHTLRLSSTGGNPEYWTLTNEKLPAPLPVTGEARIRKLGADTGAGLSGCKIEVKNASGTPVGQYTTGNDGYAVIAGLAPGSYTYREIQAPPCYLLDNNEYAFTVSETGEVTGTMSFSNARITTSAPIKKVDDKGNPLSGATIVVLDAKQKQVYSGKTGAAGIVTVNGLKAGESYTYYESAAPEGYLLNSTKYTLAVSDKGIVSGLKDIVNQPKSSPTPTPTPKPTPTPSPTPKPSATPTATPTGTPKIEVIKPIPQTGVDNGALWYGIGALLLLGAAGYAGVRFYRKQRS
ncbi:MAG TPA: SpaA isopeptide-forming pilin-related protein [Clostridia bacterium]|nr:SpaA isopeptide-forming pilin-related protein [Clostridia bacterium]